MNKEEFLREGLEKGREAAKNAECPNCGHVGPEEVWGQYIGGMPSYHLRCPECGYQNFGHRFMAEDEPNQYEPTPTST